MMKAGHLQFVSRYRYGDPREKRHRVKGPPKAASKASRVLPEAGTNTRRSAARTARPAGAPAAREAKR